MDGHGRHCAAASSRRGTDLSVYSHEEIGPGIELISEAGISVDTQSALLLSASLGRRSKEGPSPLTAVEYRELVTGLFAEGLRPGDLLQPNAAASISALLLRFPEKLRQRVTRDRLARLLDRGGQLAFALTRWTSAGIWVASRADDNYPSRYKKKLGRSAPPVVYGVGPAALLERGGLAVVGTRKPDESSEQYTAHVGAWAASAGVQIVSGAARGVDERSMLSCVNAGGTALGIVAESLFKLSTRRDFRDAILSGNLTLISSFDPDAGFTVANAMGRNRWIYALADRALVVACSEGRGGTWAGAIEALKQGVSVFVRTGNPARPGNEALVARGAIPAPA
ncbi:MAG: DNA-processing protein DprA, partial [Candidatus Baltobacteraceae bacterium]